MARAGKIPGETGFNLLQRDVALYYKTVPAVVKHSSEALLLVVSNPVDVFPYLALQLSGLGSRRVASFAPPSSGSSSTSPPPSTHRTCSLFDGFQKKVAYATGLPDTLHICESISKYATKFNGRNPTNEIAIMLGKDSQTTTVSPSTANQFTAAPPQPYGSP
ncbi:unnamed protein product [Triticum turgidum subsp. durum]|uniref:Lactate/malate dehydrogenase N-terminal domain-containing protein n=1 Tax=Triticum turgidum subsp. durum TaxID=4567 RepID=A0A9R0WJF7_TRITD|nr:unnamed protein product [Triticum turgidum subsp. durum]